MWLVMQYFLTGRGAQFPVPWYLFTIRKHYLQVVLRRQPPESMADEVAENAHAHNYC